MSQFTFWHTLTITSALVAALVKMRSGDIGFIWPAAAAVWCFMEATKKAPLWGFSFTTPHSN